MVHLFTSQKMFVVQLNYLLILESTLKKLVSLKEHLIIADKGSYVSYLEGCTAPQRDTNQLHAANVELIALDDAEIKYSTIQNWYPGDEKAREEFIIL